jgi:hypothetical protein
MSIEVPGKTVTYLLVLGIFLGVYGFYGVRRRLHERRVSRSGQLRRE